MLTKTNLSQYIIAMERLRVCYGRVPKLCTTGKLDQAGMWEGSRNKCSLLFPQASLLFSSLQPLAPYTTAKLQACSSARSQVWLLLFASPCTSILLSWCPSQPLLPSFSNLFFFHIRFSAQFTVQPVQHFCTQDRVRQRQEEIAGNVPASPVAALPIHTVPPSVSVISNYAAA